MPNPPDVRATSHDRHDPMVVAALAAGDLAGTDRDQAIRLIDMCSDCAALHADLIAISRATAAVPPPYVLAGRDFRITASQAARLRPAGWRRLLSLGRPLATFGGPVGAGLATIGIVGLLIGNLSFGLGGSAASAPNTDRLTGAGGGQRAFPAATDVGGSRGPYGASAVPAAAASSGVLGPESQASTPPGAQYQGSDTGASPSPAPYPKAGQVEVALGGPTPGARSSVVVGEPGPTAEQTSSGLPSPNVLFAATIVIGIGLILASRRVGKRRI